MRYFLTILFLGSWLSSSWLQAQPTLHDLYPGTEDSEAAFFTEFQGETYFLAQNGPASQALWKTDGAQVDFLLTLPPPVHAPTRNFWQLNAAASNLAVLGGNLFLLYDRQLWRYDGQALQAVTSLPASAANLIAWQGSLYFFTFDGSLPSLTLSLWKSDGSAGGTAPVNDFPPLGNQEPLVASEGAFVGEIGGKLLFFISRDLTINLFSYEPGAGVVPLIPEPGIYGGLFKYQGVVEGRLFFTGFPTQIRFFDVALWTSDGSPVGTQVVASPEPPGTDGNTVALGPLGDRYLVKTYGFEFALNREAIWSVDRQDPSQKELLAQVDGGSLLPYPTEAGLFFKQNDQWYFSDGTQAGTVPLAIADPELLSARVVSSWQNKLFLVSGDKLLAVDVDSWQKTVLATGLSTSYSLALRKFASTDAAWFFTAATAETGLELWRTDGSPEGTQLVAELEVGAGSSFPELKAELPTGSWLMEAFTSANGREPYLFDPERPYIRDFTLIDGQHDTELGLLSDGDLIDLDQLSTNRLNLRANTVPWEIGSVVYELNGQFFRNENNPPYCLTGSSKRAPYNYYYLTAGPGAYQVTATPYSSKAGGGTAFEKAEVSFQITGGNTLRQALTAPALSPNPAPGALQLDWPEAAGQAVALRVYDLQGRLLTEQALPASPDGQHKLNLHSLANGLYLLELRSLDLRASERVMIER